MTVAPSSLPQVWGTVGATTISGFSNTGTWILTWITLTGGNYVRNPPGGYPVPPYPGPVSASKTATPKTLANGTRIQLYADEAAALVANNCAIYS